MEDSNVGSLRSMHLAFILLAILGADAFGAWSVWHYAHTQDLPILVLGIVSVLGGIGLVVYAFRLVKNLDSARIQ